VGVGHLILRRESLLSSGMVGRCRKDLDVDHYGLEKLKKRVVEYLAVRQIKNSLRGPILCFVGPPGVGKTSIGRSIAKTLGRQFHRYLTNDQSKIEYVPPPSDCLNTKTQQHRNTIRKIHTTTQWTLWSVTFRNISKIGAKGWKGDGRKREGKEPEKGKGSRVPLPLQSYF